MTGLVRKATLFAAGGLFAAGVAVANVPDPANSDCVNAALGALCPKLNVYVVGDNGAGVIDPVAEFCVTVRDFNNVPIENSSVVIDFTDCDVQLCVVQDITPGDGVNDGVTVVCDGPTKTVRKLTDALGMACFRVRGKSYPGLGCGGAAKDCVKIFADGVLLCTGDAPTFDLVGQTVPDGLTPSDLSEFFRLWLICGTNAARANYDCSNQILTPGDLSIFFRTWLITAGSTHNCSGAKDPQVGPKCP